MTTMGRTLGIAARPVTTFQSAHDVNADKAISKFFWHNAKNGAWDPIEEALCEEDGQLAKFCKDKSGGQCAGAACRRAISLGEGVATNCPLGKAVCEKCIPCTSESDSVWSFHVWNDFWFKRRDVPATRGKGGWQAVDATPQEESDGLYQMGPADVGLIKKNTDEQCFDSTFVTSEVASDIKLYLLEGDSMEQALKSPSFEAGKDKASYWGGLKYPEDPFGDKYNTVGFLIASKKPGLISSACRANGAKCRKETDSLNKLYKSHKKPHGDPPAGANQGQCSGYRGAIYGSSSAQRFKTYQSQTQSKSDVRTAKGYLKVDVARFLRAKRGWEEEEDNAAVVPMAKKAKQQSKQQSSLSFDFGSNPHPAAVVDSPYTLKVGITNNGTKAKKVKLGFSGVGLDYRGKRLIYKKTRSGEVHMNTI